ncbi:uncharacterized protein LOC113343283 [Papaver somniferum]|uniref:uncharacterized protein LOC113343283 n=1 Tax=Papaver somniferum TaxID=3469 RepID=UPI000E6FC02C|nr:uncharacterized protein LOC113343283 [Papaver somniferum]
MITDQNSFCARILIAKYFHNKDPLSDKITSNGSWIWKSIHRGLKIFKKYYIWSVGDGSRVKIWRHNWIPWVHHSQLSNAAQFSDNNDTVKSLIQQENTQWHLKLPYKLNLFIWRCFKDILQTRTRLGRHMQLEDYSFPFCKQQPETDMHILLQCNLAKAIWFFLLPEAMDSQQQFNSPQEWIKSWNQAQSITCFKNENNILLATVIMWQIWKSRCITVFEEKVSHPNSIIISIRQLCMKYNILGSETNPISRNNNSKPKNKWKKPPENW